MALNAIGKASHINITKNNVEYSSLTNTPPTVINPISDLNTLTSGFSVTSIPLANVFNDVDDASLSYSVVVTDSMIITATVDNDTLYLYEGTSTGSTTVTITAYDSNGGSISDAFSVTVNPPPADLNMENGSFIACDRIFKDAGGDEHYPNDADITMTLLPAVDGEYIQVTFTSFELEDGFDKLFVYDALSKDNSQLIGTFSGETLPDVLTASNADGALTFHFTSDSDINKGGWVANISCINNQAASNNSPIVKNPIPNQEISDDLTNKVISLQDVFYDADNDPLIYEAISSNEAVITSEIVSSNKELVLTLKASTGNSTITVYAEDPYGAWTSTEFSVNITESGNISLEDIIDVQATFNLNKTIDLSANSQIQIKVKEPQLIEKIETGRVSINQWFITPNDNYGNALYNLMSLENDNTYRVTLSPFEDPFGTAYFFKVTATDGQTMYFPKHPNQWLVSYKSYTSSDIPLQQTVGIGDKAEDYRIISLPLRTQDRDMSINHIFSSLGTYDNTKWRVFKWVNNSYQELNGNDILQPGKAYWFISKEQVNASFPAMTSEVIDNVGQYNSADQNITLSELSFEQGWNMISTPYNLPIDWVGFKTFHSLKNNLVNNLSEELYHWDGAVNTSSTLEPFKGYFVYNSGPSFKVKVIPSAQTYQNSATSNLRTTASQNWQVPLQIKSNAKWHHISKIGMHAQAKVGIDSFDGLRVPLLMDIPKAQFYRPDFKTSEVTGDIIPATEQATWNASFSSTESNHIHIQWERPLLPYGKKLLIMDTETRALYDMQAVQQFQKNASHVNLKFIYGNSSEIMELLNDQLFYVNVYPIPSHEHTKFDITIPEGEHQLSLSIINMTGEIVKQVYQGKISKGQYRFIWNTTNNQHINVSKGVYLYQIQMDDQITTGKLLIK
ncbi:hypothetical protein GCM10023331_01660 [Algivirga pacifica]|uniref:CUB domain-containing protein n=2 Tax=Algivirga pacifica TaxID=1162670 RepID=A0ABP9D2T7_9BACT